MEPNGKVAKEKRLVALVLLYIFGMLGAHRFYVGKQDTAIAQLCLFILGSITFFVPVLLIIVFIWVFIDMITILMGNFENSKGEKLVEWT